MDSLKKSVIGLMAFSSKFKSESFQDFGEFFFANSDDE